MTTANAALYRVSLPVPDIAQAARFYGEVEAPGERVSPGRHYFDCAGTILALYDPVADGDGLEGGGIITRASISTSRSPTSPRCGIGSWRQARVT